MGRKLRPIKTIIKNAVLQALVFAGLMALYYWNEDKDFDVVKFILHFIGFALFSAIAFRYKYVKDK